WGNPTDSAKIAVNEVRRRAYGKDLPKETVRFIRTVSGGSNYTSVPTVTVSGGGGSGLEVQAFINPITKVVSHIKVLNGGTGYTSAPIITITGGGGSGATATAIITQRATSNHLLDESRY